LLSVTNGFTIVISIAKAKHLKLSVMKKNYFLNGFIMAVMLIMTGNMLATGQVILYEDFENGGDLPTNWTQIYEDGDNAWYAQDGDNGSLSAYAGDYNAAFTHETTGDVTKLITPSLDLSSYDSPELVFWHAQAVWAGDQDELGFTTRRLAVAVGH